MRLKRIEPFSCAKINGVLGALMGLIVGGFASLFSMLGAALGGGSDAGMFGAIFGIGAIILMPIFYGFMGFITGGIGAWLYNLVANWMGGLELDFEEGNFNR